MPNNANLADIENTFIQEVAWHDGLRVLFSPDEKLNNIPDELYMVSGDSITLVFTLSLGCANTFKLLEAYSNAVRLKTVWDNDK